MQIFDRIQTGNTRRTQDGYLVADARVARTGVQVYRGAELDRPDLPTVRVFRAQDVVFGRDAMQSYAYRPLTSGHPDEMVTADNWREFSIGQTGGDVVRDGEFVRVPLVMMDAAAIAEFEGGKRELSMGYDATIEFTAGVTDSGEEYDAVQKSMRMNHLAIVDIARGGNELRIGDRRTPDFALPLDGGQKMADLKSVVVDGLTIETSAQGVEAINKLTKQLADSKAASAEIESTHTKAIEAKDAELAKLDAKVADLESKQLSDADLDKRVQDRADLIARAVKVADRDYSGMADADIRKAAVVAVLGDEAIKDKSEAYVEARFDLLQETDPRNPAAPTQKVTDNGQGAYEARLRDAWKSKEVA